MSETMNRLAAFRQEGSKKFASFAEAGNAVRCFADAKRENSADDYDLQRIDEAAAATVETSVDQSVEVYKMFAQPEKE